VDEKRVTIGIFTIKLLEVWYVVRRAKKKTEPRRFSRDVKKAPRRKGNLRYNPHARHHPSDWSTRLIVPLPPPT
jgi:hypothetical protein